MPTTTQEIPKAAWARSFQLISKQLQGQDVVIEVIGSTIGYQIEERGTIFGEMTYNHKENSIYIITGPIDHQIFGPKKVSFKIEGAAVSAIEVVDKDEQIQLLRFKNPMMLPDMI
jgi:hypothetical protein